MHELSIMGNILDIVLEYANKNNAKVVKTINLKIGELSDVIPDWAQMYFDMLSKDTIAEEATLIIDKIPVMLHCNDCNHEFKVLKEDIKFFCEKCESANIELLSGRELAVESIEID